jgi:osmotically-inducible protein OsmY
VNVIDQDLKQAEQKAKPEADKLDIGVRVTTALNANANLPHTIRVDANTSGVRLRGHVQTQAQKKLAGQIAKETLPQGKSVDNEVAVKA